MNSNEKKKGLQFYMLFICRVGKTVASSNKRRGKGLKRRQKAKTECATVGALESIGNGRLERRKGDEGDEKRGMEREAERRVERKINKVIKHELRAEMTS